jgi:hypothetical protein
MRRLEFVGGLGGAVAWPLVAQAQQPKHADIAPRLRRAASITAVGTAQKAGTANQHNQRRVTNHGVGGGENPAGWWARPPSSGLMPHIRSVVYICGKRERRDPQNV